MKLYTVFFGVDYEGERLEGVFSTMEAAQEQVELSKKAHNYYCGDEPWEFGFDDDLDTECWRRSDLYLVISETELDRKKYERLSD
jgi:hypothetical protein